MALATTLPTLYQHYTSGGITNGLSIDQPQFTLNNKNVTILSGAIHYFRIPKQYWRDRLRKLRATGLNTVETYIPWNLHEPQNGTYDFGNGGTDMEDFLDLKEFLTITKEEDLFAIIRPGPYICAEFEFGGLPSWLLRENGIELRTSDTKFMNYIRRYFSVLLPILAAFQFLNGGPIMAFQVENEYASTPYRKDQEYLQQLYNLFRQHGINELLLTSDNDFAAQSGTIPGLLFQTINFGDSPIAKLDELSRIQPGKPLMVMEFWEGWYDHWSEEHHTVSNEKFYDYYDKILNYPASVNIYMFHGGTNWGFLNGANIGSTGNGDFQPTITSYDYDAVLTEAGDYTTKYESVKALIEKYNTVKVSTPQVPPLVPRVAYQTTKVASIIPYDGILQQINEVIETRTPIPMELLPINNNSGQSYGYTIYRKEHIDVQANSTLTISGYIYDSVIVLINNVLITRRLSSSADLDDFGYWRQKDSSIILTNETLTNATIDLLIENWGRVNYGASRHQFKGLQDSVLLNNEEIVDWKIIPLEFKRKWNENLSGWQQNIANYTGPALYKSVFTVDELRDTYVNMEEWCQGIVIINGFVLGRYVKIGPQQTLYLPAPLLRIGDNQLVVFEHFEAPLNIKFSTDPIYKTI